MYFFVDTPLGIACGRFGNPSMILTLVSGGTHIDFRGKDGLLPIHRAAIGGNSKAIKVYRYLRVVSLINSTVSYVQEVQIY